MFKKLDEVLERDRTGISPRNVILNIYLGVILTLPLGLALYALFAFAGRGDNLDHMKYSLLFTLSGVFSYVFTKIIGIKRIGHEVGSISRFALTVVAGITFIILIRIF